jgi:hypothetical protein
MTDVAMQSRGGKWTWAIAAGLTWAIAAGCLRSPQTPDSPVAQIACESMAAYARGVAESFDDAQRKLESGELRTAVEANRWLQSSNAAARQRAFEPLDALLNEELGGEKWDIEKARRIFGEIAWGLRTAPRRVK